ncbi:hypothetical protein ACFQT0_13695 [Hymenobacter humi]|uniref:Lipoprotein n=1 Tax=Hymenobacter humi TaxID=1411620 RepID=A0ABW2U7H2_9BACT
MRPVLFALFVGVVVAVGACSGSHEPPYDRTARSAPKPARDASGLNVPGLLALSIDELGQQAGRATRCPQASKTR